MSIKCLIDARKVYLRIIQEKIGVWGGSIELIKGWVGMFSFLLDIVIITRTLYRKYYATQGFILGKVYIQLEVLIYKKVFSLFQLKFIFVEYIYPWYGIDLTMLFCGILIIMYALYNNINHLRIPSFIHSFLHSSSILIYIYSPNTLNV